MDMPLVLSIRITSPRVESRRSYSVRTEDQSIEDRIEVVFDAADGSEHHWVVRLQFQGTLQQLQGI